MAFRIKNCTSRSQLLVLNSGVERMLGGGELLENVPDSEVRSNSGLEHLRQKGIIALTKVTHSEASDAVALPTKNHGARTRNESPKS